MSIAARSPRGGWQPFAYTSDRAASMSQGVAPASYQFAFNRLDMMSIHELQGVVDEELDRWG